MTLNEYRKKYNLSKYKALASLKYVENINICPYCKKIEIPNDANVYYVPDKRIMKNSDYRKYYYVLDAIINKQIIHNKLISLNDKEIESIIGELHLIKYIKLKNKQNEGSLDYRDYIETIEGINWKNADSKRRKENLNNALKIILNISSAISKIA